MNQLSQQELWEKIRNFQLDDPASAFPFSRKLAHQNNWTTTFTNRAIEEYKKFIFLCCISPTGASPSAIVDEVWHLHLTYTDNYWNRFCKNTLSKEIHHHPSKGGTGEKEKHENWYVATLLLYEQQFNSKPPQDIWPPGNEMTTEIEEDIYEPDFFRRLLFLFASVLVLFILGVNLFHTKGQDFLGYYLFISLAGLVVLLITQLHKNSRLKTIVGNNIPQKFTAYQVARFLYGNHRCYQTALVDLLRRGIIQTSGNDYKIARPKMYVAEGDDNPLLQPLMQQFNEDDIFTYNEGLGLIDRDTVLHPGLERLHRLSKKVDYLKLIVPGIVLLVGFARFLQGMANDKPVGLLVFEMGAFGFIALAILQYFSYTKTVRQHLGVYWDEQNSYGQSSNVINNFTILGAAAIAGFAEYSVLKNVFHSFSAKEKRYSGDGSAGCSSGCGSSCGGSGCGGGGCGGCGGGD
ncbi:TIGR04222 domain-containing membrane protein [Ferruginibacter profundus]